MNIIIVSSDYIPEKTLKEPFEKAELLRVLDENKKLRLFLAEEFSSLGANVLIIEPDFSGKSHKTAMEFFDSDGISRVFVNLDSKKPDRLLSGKDILRFCSKAADNSAAIGGIFLPDIVISSGSFPFGIGAAEKIAEESSAVLITELFCPPDFLIKTGAIKKPSPVLILLKKAEKSAFDKSSAVLGFYKQEKEALFGAHGFFPMDFPFFEPKKTTSSEAFSLYEKLFTFREGKTPVLATESPLENGFSIEELIFAAKEFSGKINLVFLSGGSKKPLYKSMIREKGINNVFFLDPIPKGEASFVLSAADFVFVSENKIIGAHSKELFYSALYSGKPVLAAMEKEADFIKKSAAAVITKPKNKESLRLGIKALLDMSETDREALGLSGKAFCNKNSAKNFSIEYFSLLEHLVKQKENKK
ncbi:MAG: hypothetical protein IKU42_04855 [Oscillospiraceae bacterium]|nr:hypothetical protein [Oscillospiraceae bacterium]